MYMHRAFSAWSCKSHSKERLYCTYAMAFLKVPPILQHQAPSVHPAKSLTRLARQPEQRSMQFLLNPFAKPHRTLWSIRYMYVMLSIGGWFCHIHKSTATGQHGKISKWQIFKESFQNPQFLHIVLQSVTDPLPGEKGRSE